ncbi:hypothetical protein DFH29DRAFT_1029819 [Suillus ampliporus]|nr:hypothetical protein DFH29DRAFT_1029819 [Suillus ampliporus]
MAPAYRLSSTFSEAFLRSARQELSAAYTQLDPASCFEEAVIDPTAQVVSKAEKVSFGLVALSVCSSTIVLVLASDAAAQDFFSNGAKCIPTPKDDNTDFATPIAIRPVEIYRQCPPSPSSPRIIESTETKTAPPITCSMPCIVPTSLNLYSKPLSTDTYDCESLGDESTVHEDDRSDAHPSLRKLEYEPEYTTAHADHLIDIPIAKMTALDLDEVLAGVFPPKRLKAASGFAHTPTHSTRLRCQRSPTDDAPNMPLHCPPRPRASPPKKLKAIFSSIHACTMLRVFDPYDPIPMTY